MTPRELPTPDDDLDRQVLDTVAREGWMVLAIEGDNEGPEYAFSVGLFHTLGHPEVVLMGQRPAVAQDLINDLGARIRDGAKFEAGQHYEEIASNFPLAFVAVDTDHYRPYLGYARWFYRGNGFPALQCVWPDKKGLFPWEEGYDADFFEVQRVLGAAGSWERGWPFGEPPNQATFIVRSIADQSAPILYAVHDSDGSWQFLPGGPVTMAEALLVALEIPLRLDPGLIVLSDLPRGWTARRDAVGAPWVREPREEPRDKNE
jgi:hypothetical protein